MVFIHFALIIGPRRSTGITPLLHYDETVRLPKCCEDLENTHQYNLAACTGVSSIFISKCLLNINLLGSTRA
jgi:hypothetical protein